MSRGKKQIEWRCGMCGRWSPMRFRSRCQRCGAVRGLGYPDRTEVEERATRPATDRSEEEGGCSENPHGKLEQVDAPPHGN